MDYSFPGTGSLTPEVIFVGERINPNKLKEANGVPFALGPAAEWLIEAIWEANLQSKVYLTNAKKVNGDEQMIAREIRWLRARAHTEERGLPRVISLGRIASRVLTDHRIPHEPLVHPSYHRRFHHADGPSSYARLIQGF
jgi:hypothetical protein